jgi:hypothetical protein
MLRTIDGIDLASAGDGRESISDHGGEAGAWALALASATHRQSLSGRRVTLSYPRVEMMM